MCNRDLNGDVTVDLIHEYRTWGLNKLGEARIVYEQEVSDMARHFGELHFIPLALYKIMGDLLDQLGEFGKSKTLRMRIRDRIDNTGGIGHSYYFQSTEHVATSHRRLGGWMEAQLLEEEVLKRTKSTGAQIFQEEVLKHMKSTYGAQSIIIHNLISKLAWATSHRHTGTKGDGMRPRSCKSRSWRQRRWYLAKSI